MGERSLAVSTLKLSAESYVKWSYDYEATSMHYDNVWNAAFLANP